MVQGEPARRVSEVLGRLARGPSARDGARHRAVVAWTGHVGARREGENRDTSDESEQVFAGHGRLLRGDECKTIRPT